MHESEAMKFVELVLNSFTRKYLEHFENDNFDEKSYKGYLNLFAKAVRGKTGEETDRNARRVISAILEKDRKYCFINKEDLEIELSGLCFSKELEAILDLVASNRDITVKSPFGDLSAFFREV